MLKSWRRSIFEAFTWGVEPFTTWQSDMSDCVYMREHCFGYMGTVLGRTHQKHSQVIAFTLGNNSFARTMPGPPSWRRVYIREHNLVPSMPRLPRLSVYDGDQRWLGCFVTRLQYDFGHFASANDKIWLRWTFRPSVPASQKNRRE